MSAKWMFLASVVMSLILVSFTGTSSGTEIDPVVKTLVKDDFNSLNKTFWNSANYSYYTTENSYLKSAELPWGRYVQMNLALTHSTFDTSDHLIYSLHIRLDANYSYATRGYYRFYNYFFFSSTEYLLFYYHGDYLEVTKYQGSNGIRLYGGYLRNAGNYTLNVKVGSGSLSYTLMRETTVFTKGSVRVFNMDGSLEVRLLWWWASSTQPTDTNTRYTISVDSVSLYAYDIVEKNVADSGEENGGYWLMDAIVQHSTELMMVTIVGAFLVVSLTSNSYAKGIGMIVGLITSGIFFTTLIGVTHLNYVISLITALGVAFGVEGIYYNIKGNENIMSEWGIEIAILLLGIAIVLLGVV